MRSEYKEETMGTAISPSTSSDYVFPPTSYSCLFTLSGHVGDVYTVAFHPGQNHIVTGGYDKTIKIYDIRTGTLVKEFQGHKSSVSSAIFNPSGNIIISGSKDGSIKFWDIASGVCIKTISSHLGEVTSVEINSSGNLLLSGSKDNSNRLWDLRDNFHSQSQASLGSTYTYKPIKKYKGHQNTSKNFIRSSFGGLNESLIIGGSEDGSIYMWDIDSCNIVKKISNGHNGYVVYQAIWNEHQSLLARYSLLFVLTIPSCSHDHTVKTWRYS